MARFLLAIGYSLFSSYLRSKKFDSTTLKPRFLMADNKPDSDKDSTMDSHAQLQAPVNDSRRRLTGAGLGMSVIFTLASRPVLGATCTTASAAASGNLSQHGAPLLCVGRTPAFWKNPQHVAEWLLTPYTQGTCSGGGCSSSPDNWTGGTAFHPLFGGSNFKINNKSLSLNQVMVMNDSSYGVTDPDNLGAHIVAALLNAASGKTDSVMSVTTVIGMWNEWVAKGYFEPNAGVKWSSAQIVTYLKTTMPV